jgi:penicillin G amidase
MRWLKYTGAALALSVVVGLVLAHGALRASLPQLDGEVRGGVTAAVRIARDARGVPTIEAANRTDLAYATGFVHAQDRFFQMDLSRRLAAGELAELFGPVALEQDRNTRLFRFRALARDVLASGSAAQRALLEAYTRGVNAGLAQLAGRPWEYWLLGEPPQPWHPEDTLLVSYAMWWDLQANGLRREILRREINARLGGALCAGGWKCALSFLYPPTTEWDAPVAPASHELPAPPPLPDAGVLDIRSAAAPAASAAALAPAAGSGSNSWAVAGTLTSTGAALIANDMHLAQRVPPVWYHARLRIAASAADGGLDLNGVTLPGTPLLVAGSNGHVAWGFTNSYGDWIDIERVPCTAVSGTTLTTPYGNTALTVVHEQIRVKGAAPAELEVKSGPAGLLLKVDEPAQVCWFGSWLAQLPAATNMNLMDMEQARSVADALALAPGIGTPHQNAVLGDDQGHIAWTIFGRVPEDIGPTRASGRGPWTSAADHPRILDPPLGRIWTANARVADEERALQLIGGQVATLGAEYNLGARAGQIRDDLLGLKGAITPADMLRIQLDDRALFLARWREQLLTVLDPARLAGHPQRAALRRLVENWKPQASIDSVGYRIVRTFHDTTRQAAWRMLLGGLGVSDDEGLPPPEQFEASLWRMLSTQPPHLLARQYDSWPKFLEAQVDATLATLAGSCPELSRCSWGAHNLVRVRHPLSRALPWLASFLDMPTLELPGDHDMPRVQDGAFGASERFAVSPGHEAQGYLHIPGGQSGHPLSPYYRAGFTEWARGEALPFLPGPTQHTLTLSP